MDNRISTRYQYDAFTFSMNRAQVRLAESERQLATGKRINDLSDDPFGAGRAISMRSVRSALQQYTENLKVAKGVLSFAEQAVGSIHDLTKRAYELAVSGGNDATSQFGRATMASEVGELQRKLVTLANDQGPSQQRLFGGNVTQSPPYVVSGGTLTYVGDSAQQMIEIGPGETMVANTLLQPAVTDLYSRLESLKNNLLSNNVGALSGVDIAALQSSMTTVNGVRGEIGARLRRVNEQTALHDRRTDELTAGISDVEDVDMAEAITNYKMNETAYQAALQTASQGFRLSLMDFLR